MPRDIKNKMLVYHLTALENLPSILANGLMARAELQANSFEDIADSEIIRSRAEQSLDSYVPFHFFSRTPFDYAAQRGNIDVPFILIAVRRSHAKARSWKIIPRHPLSLNNGEKVVIMEYDQGIEAINWALMESTDHCYGADSDYKQACMAECLSPTAVSAANFHSIFVKTDEDKSIVLGLLKEAGIDLHVNLVPTMFVN
ncbi:DUF4433 domain-containing protein [Hahella sp. KA22]|uniref:DarT ssDNA thymidine ADP-ribosyltransferase family protein n=1 Tax=Hahella sp. KA22 TaxID=1628392 RepID=UPI000FDD6F60|nr:DarT ssDNA thymidine ADP-ribosyltransferase family protein [Hahella sp. KA22]AZZ92434.1 DUF4433 domain-containing protein [Hahella sp. KA22]QAY55808.1 DUF4433 domain-containing protein [Hahella sp. KA22]